MIIIIFLLCVAYRDNVLQVEQMDQILASARLCIQGVVTKLKVSDTVIVEPSKKKKKRKKIGTALIKEVSSFQSVLLRGVPL